MVGHRYLANTFTIKRVFHILFKMVVFLLTKHFIAKCTLL